MYVDIFTSARYISRLGKYIVQICHYCVTRQVMETENHYYLVLEMVRGGDLMTHICNNKRLSEQEAQKYTRQIISAVEYLHSMGIVHR